MMDKSQHYLLGLEGEQFALKYLLDKGYNILETRWRFRNLEIDIISIKENLLVIIEVKTRTSDYFGEPYIFVNKKKQRNIIEATNFFVENKKLDLEIRFDIISLLKKNQEFILNHIENAFIPLN